MELLAFTVRDQKAEVYNQPFFQKTKMEAIRSFNRLVRDPQSMISQYPEDYDLYWIGTYNDQTGVISSLDTPQHIEKAINLKETPQ